MEKIEVKRDAYVVIMDTKNDEEFKSFLEEFCSKLIYIQ